MVAVAGGLQTSLAKFCCFRVRFGCKLTEPLTSELDSFTKCSINEPNQLFQAKF